MPYVNCAHCSGNPPNRLLEIINLPMPYCSACGKIACHVCRASINAGGCKNKNYAAATVNLVGPYTRRGGAAPALKMATVTVDAGGIKKPYQYHCPPGTYPPNSSDVLDIWTATEGKSYNMKAATNGSGGGKSNASSSAVFSQRAGTSGLKHYGGNDHFHVSVAGYSLGSKTRVWYCVDTSTNPVTVKFSAILDS